MLLQHHPTSLYQHNSQLKLQHVITWVKWVGVTQQNIFFLSIIM